MLAASRLRRCGQAWFERPGLPTSCCCGTPVSVRPAVSGWAGRVSAGSQLSGVVVQIRGGSVIFGPCLVSLPALLYWHTPWWGAVARAAARAFGRAVAQQDGSFVGSCVA